MITGQSRIRNVNTIMQKRKQRRQQKWILPSKIPSKNTSITRNNIPITNYPIQSIIPPNIPNAFTNIPQF